ncbi:hypothetical protein X566_03150 [Afipia sp. P52-10]|uniref:hypothetical protein n=1 Tax=Afipia sp. P52-10 TaxID=1429916 RepID=UPI0003DF2F7F|nr:hypothetical protein [Afipia sp. P52-10]ETR78934.1 hypothetical protein X566_03150 [Afipia sp. P52-10]
MSEAIPSDVFRTLIETTGLTLTPEQFDELRSAYPKMKAMMARLQGPRDVSVEPALVFSARA